MTSNPQHQIIAVDTLARTIWGEARGDGAAGMHAVACVINNRVKAKKRHYGLDHRGVCRRAWQFSCWNAGDPNLPKLQTVGRDDPEFRIAWEIAEACIGGRLADITSGATHYHTKALQPKWTDGKAPHLRLGVHLFYRDVD